MFILQAKSGQARAGILKTRRGQISTPFFMPIATKGAVKTLSADELRELAPGIILSNTYHLMLRPGSEEIKKLGGLHKLMDWDKAILTDSGGFQVFSLSKMRKITEDGVMFNSHIDGKKMMLTPEDSIKIQMNIGSDIMMVLDECVELPAKRAYLEKSVDLTTRWAKRCLTYHKKHQEKKRALLLGIVQGGTDRELRLKSAHDLAKLAFDGLAIGGLAVGESEQEMYSVLDYLTAELPSNKPRYLMGVGYPHQIVAAVKRGVDMFDCVIPTREARHGRLYFWSPAFQNNLLEAQDREFYFTENCKTEKFKFDLSPINSASYFDSLRKYSKAYLRHLFVTEDPLASRLCTLNNLEFYLTLMRRLREEILNSSK